VSFDPRRRVRNTTNDDFYRCWNSKRRKRWASYIEFASWRWECPETPLTNADVQPDRPPFITPQTHIFLILTVKDYIKLHVFETTFQWTILNTSSRPIFVILPVTIPETLSHRLHAVHTCGLLLQTTHVAWYACVSVLGTRVKCTKKVERLRCVLGVTHVGPRNHLGY